MAKIFMVITDCGDGSNGVSWVKDPLVIDKMQALADEGDETYSSGDGLQARELFFPDIIDIDAWAHVNFISWTTLEDFE